MTRLLPRPLLRAALTTLLLLPLGAAALPAGVTQGPTVEGITEYRLANGMTVVLFPDAGSPTTSVNVTYRVGSRHERYGETGMAHLLEHLLFKGTRDLPSLWDEMTRRGMRVNGSTWYDRTNYFETFNASPADLEWALRAEADRMVNSRLDRKDLDTEMTVVRNEMERGENRPGRIVLQRTIGAAYRWHNYGHETIGARSDVEGVDIESLRAFYRTYYQPDNAVLVVAGAFDVDATLGWIAKYFGAIPKPARALPRLYTTEPVQDGERRVTIRRVGDQQLVGIAYHTVPGAHPDQAALEALVAIMTIEPAGRLYKALVDTRKASAVGGWAPALHDPGFVYFEVQVPLGESVDVARDAALATLEGIDADPITPAEVERARARAQKRVDEALADPTRFGISLSESIAAGDWRLFFLQRDRMRKLQADDVQRVAAQYLKPANRTVAQFIPEAKPDRAPAAPSVDVASLLQGYEGDPAVGTGEVFVATPENLDARTERFTLGDGLKVALLPKKTRGQTVKVAVQIDQGDAQSLTGTGVQGELMAAMLARGTARRSRQEIVDTTDRLRAKIVFEGAATRTAARIETYRGELPATLALVAEMLREPAFPADEFAKLQREEIAAREAKRTDPEALARLVARRHANPYPAGDPRYVPTVDEAVALVRDARVDDIIDFHRRFVGGVGEIAIVGDFDPVAIRATLEQAFGSWPKAPAAYARVPHPFVAPSAQIVTIETPDKANAALFGELALAASDTAADHGAMALAAHLLGSGPSSRLWKRIRDRDGLSYGAYAFVDWNPVEPNSALNVTAIFAPQNRERLAAALLDELQRAAADGFTDTEVASAREALLKRRHLARTQDAAIAAALVQQAHLGRTFAAAGKTDAAIAKASAADVNAALRKYVQPTGFTLVYAGDFAKSAK